MTCATGGVLVYKHPPSQFYQDFSILSERIPFKFLPDLKYDHPGVWVNVGPCQSNCQSTRFGFHRKNVDFFMFSLSWLYHIQSESTFIQLDENGNNLNGNHVHDVCWTQRMNTITYRKSRDWKNAWHWYRPLRGGSA